MSGHDENGSGSTFWIASWMRRVVPEGYVRAMLYLEGTAPVLMKSGEADPDSELYRAYILLGKKKGKSLDDERRLREMEWQLGLYLDDELGPYWPGKNIHELLRESATKWRKGEEIKRSLIVVESRIPLQYEGPRTQQELWDAGFRYTAMVSNGGAGRGRVRRCRPCFPGWSLEAEVAFDPEDLDFDLLEMIVERSQKFGAGDYRPLFGSFRARIELLDVRKNGARGSATKPRDEQEEQAHTARKGRILVGNA
jgi:hypothetical protein